MRFFFTHYTRVYKRVTQPRIASLTTFKPIVYSFAVAAFSILFHSDFVRKTIIFTSSSKKKKKNYLLNFLERVAASSLANIFVSREKKL